MSAKILEFDERPASGFEDPFAEDTNGDEDEDDVETEEQSKERKKLPRIDFDDDQDEASFFITDAPCSPHVARFVRKFVANVNDASQVRLSKRFVEVVYTILARHGVRMTYFHAGSRAWRYSRHDIYRTEPLDNPGALLEALYEFERKLVFNYRVTWLYSSPIFYYRVHNGGPLMMALNNLVHQRDWPRLGALIDKQSSLVPRRQAPIKNHTEIATSTEYYAMEYTLPCVQHYFLLRILNNLKLSDDDQAERALQWLDHVRMLKFSCTEQMEFTVLACEIAALGLLRNQSAIVQLAISSVDDLHDPRHGIHLATLRLTASWRRLAEERQKLSENSASSSKRRRIEADVLPDVRDISLAESLLVVAQDQARKHSSARLALLLSADCLGQSSEEEDEDPEEGEARTATWVDGARRVALEQPSVLGPIVARLQMLQREDDLRTLLVGITLDWEADATETGHCRPAPADRVWLDWAECWLDQPNDIAVFERTHPGFGLRILTALMEYLDFGSNSGDERAWQLLRKALETNIASNDSVKTEWRTRKSWWPKMHKNNGDEVIRLLSAKKM